MNSRRELWVPELLLDDNGCIPTTLEMLVLSVGSVVMLYQQCSITTFLKPLLGIVRSEL